MADEPIDPVAVREARKKKRAPRYKVTVWNTTNGDIEKKLWDASEAELNETLEWYRDEPWFDVQFEEINNGE